MEKGKYMLKEFKAKQGSPIDIPEGEVVFVRPGQDGWASPYHVILYILCKEDDDGGVPSS